MTNNKHEAYRQQHLLYKLKAKWSKLSPRTRDVILYGFIGAKVKQRIQARKAARS